MPSASEDLPSVFTIPTDQNTSQATHESATQLNDGYMQEPSSDAQALLDLYHTTGYSQHNVPAFFDQIMVSGPDFMNLEYMQPPPDLAAWMPEVEWLGQVDIFGNDFTPALDQLFEAQALPEFIMPCTAETPKTQETSYERIDSNSAKKRHAVFKQSPWYATFICLMIRS
jgi:hypothetical protein